MGSCDGIDCGPHGSCRSGTCTCERGYIALPFNRGCKAMFGKKSKAKTTKILENTGIPSIPELPSLPDLPSLSSPTLDSTASGPDLAIYLPIFIVFGTVAILGVTLIIAITIFCVCRARRRELLLDEREDDLENECCDAACCNNFKAGLEDVGETLGRGFGELWEDLRERFRDRNGGGGRIRLDNESIVNFGTDDEEGVQLLTADPGPREARGSGSRSPGAPRQTSVPPRGPTRALPTPPPISGPQPAPIPVSVEGGRVQQLSDALLKKEQELASLRSRLGAVLESQNGLAAQLRERNAELEKVQLELGVKMSEVEAMQKEVHAKEAELQAKRDELQSTQSELRKAKSELDRKQTELDRTHNELDRKNAELDRRNAESEKLKEGLQSELESARGRLRAALEQSNGLAKEHDALQLTLQRIEEARRADREQLEERDRELARLREDHDLQIDRAQTSAAELEAANRRIGTLEKEVESKIRDFRLLEERMETDRARISELQELNSLALELGKISQMEGLGEMKGLLARFGEYAARVDGKTSDGLREESARIEDKPEEPEVPESEHSDTSNYDDPDN